MKVRKFVRAELDSEPHDVLFKDLYPWDAIEETPFGASIAVVEPGGRTELHSHTPEETYIVCRGRGTMTSDGETAALEAGDVVYLESESLHSIANTSDDEDLVFVNVYWWKATRPASVPTPVPPAVPTSSRSTLIVPSPPTSNGPLHIGHLAGPYLAADVYRRYRRLRGEDAKLVCLTDDHQSYVVRRAEQDGTTPAETAARFSAASIEALASFGATPDEVVVTATDADYESAVRDRFDRIHEHLVEHDVDELFCEACDRWLADGFVVGRCPRCDAAANGFVCQSCCLPHENAALVEPTCTRCSGTPVVRKHRRRSLPIAPFVARLERYHRELSLRPRMRQIAARITAQPELFAPATAPGTWGIDLDEDTVIAPWFEVALAGPYLRERFAPDADVVHFFGYDNAYLYLVHDPAVSLALDGGAALPRNVGVNDFLMLGDRKMSTSEGGALEAQSVLADVPPEPLRLFLAAVRPERGPTNGSMEDIGRFLGAIGPRWAQWLTSLAAAVERELGALAPAISAPSLEQDEFRAQLGALLERARRGYEGFALTEVAKVMFDVVEAAGAFARSQAPLGELEVLRHERDASIGLELAAVRLLAVVSAPVMPAFAEHLWTALGYEPATIVWSDEVTLLPAGQRIDTAKLGARPWSNDA